MICIHFLILLLAMLMIVANKGFAEEQESLSAILRDDLLHKTFETKMALGICTKSFIDEEGYSVTLSMINEIYDHEVKYFAEGGLKLVTKPGQNGSKIVSLKRYPGRYVQYDDVKLMAKGAVVEITSIGVKGGQINLELMEPNGQKAKVRLITTSSPELEDVMLRIGQVLEIECVESLQSAMQMKWKAEGRLAEAASVEDKLECMFELKEAVQSILRIKGLNSTIIEKYASLESDLDSEMKNLMASLEKPLIVGLSSSLQPSVVERGQMANLKVSYRLLAGKRERQFRVTESVLLSGQNMFLPVKKHEYEAIEGMHIFPVRFLIPADLDPGDYTLIVTIDFGEGKKMTSVAFKVIDIGPPDRK